MITRMVNRKVFGFESFSGEEVGDSRGTVRTCWQDVPADRMQKAVRKLELMRQCAEKG